MKNVGPKVSISLSCFDCIHCTSKRYNCQGDSGSDVYCEHPNFETKKRVGDTNWHTPNFCPLRTKALAEKIKEISISENFNESTNPSH